MTQPKPNTTEATALPARDAPYFLVGAERSGTTLLRLMLDHHPRLRCGHESEFLVDRLDENRRRHGDALADVWSHDRAFASYRSAGLPPPPEVQSYDELVAWFFRALREQTGKQITGVTVHLHPLALPRLSPNAKYIHLMRDGRAVAASVVQMGWAGNNYHGALYWKRTIERVLALRDRVPAEQWLDVRYEELLEEPVETLTRVCDHLNVQYDERMLSYPEDTTYAAPESGNADRWRKKLTLREIADAEMAAGDTLTTLGYAPDFPPRRAGAVRRALLAIGNRIGRWRVRGRRYGWGLLFALKLARLLRLRSPRLAARYLAISRQHIR